MDELVLIALIALAVPVSIIILFVMHFSQKNRLGLLLRRIEQLERGRDQAKAPVAKATAAKATVDKAKVVKKPAKTPDIPKKPEKPALPKVPKPESPPVTNPSDPPPAYVFRKEKAAALTEWLKENWFYAIAAVSLALSGVFFVQYGIENGYLTPFWRVMGALALGAALIVAGEWIRRRSGDENGSHTAYLPSTFSGAGLVSLFAGVLAARQMYGLIGPEMGFAGLVMVSGLAVVLGWFYGPLLATVGILGATAAPFMVGGSSDNPQIYFYYFALIAIAGLLVDAIKRWAWVSTFALIFTFGAAWFIFVQGAGDAHFLAFGLIAVTAAAAIPPLQFWPQHQGAMVSQVLAGFYSKTDQASDRRPEFPTRLASGAFIAAVVVAMLVALDDNGAAEIWLVLVVLAVLFGMAVSWFRHAPALLDMVLLPPLALLGVILVQTADRGSLYRVFRAGMHRLPESAPPWDVTVICAMALAGSALLAWRGGAAKYRLTLAGGAALFAPLVIATFEMGWSPVSVLGKGLWAWHAMIVAAAMTLFALQVARTDGEDRRRVAIYALSAMVMISFALMVMLSSSALTLAIAVKVLLAALIDRRYNLRLLSVFVQVGGVVVGWRLVVDPGVIWAYDAPLWEFILAYGGVIALFVAAWFLLQERDRKAAIVVMESAVWTLSGIFASVLLLRNFDNIGPDHVEAALFALIWLISAANQLYRLKIGGKLRWVRLGLASIFGVIGLWALAVVLTNMNPLFTRYEIVQGPPLLDTLFVAYGLPALLFAFVALRFAHLKRWFRIGLGAVASGLAALYVALEIRRFWQGDMLANYGVMEGEQYSYTIAMLLVSVGLLFFAFSRRSIPIRKVAIVGIGLTIAKVFLIDMSGLTGLIRVASFLGLGLSLAGLAWVNKRMSEQWDKIEKDEPG